MAQYLVELYSPKPAWLALDQNGRRQFFEAVSTGMEILSSLGVEPIALGETDVAALHAPSQKFFAIWRAPDAEGMNALISGIAASGWHDYFETINATGHGVDLVGHLAQLAAL